MQFAFGEPPKPIDGNKSPLKTPVSGIEKTLLDISCSFLDIVINSSHANQAHAGIRNSKIMSELGERGWQVSHVIDLKRDWPPREHP